MHITIRRAGPRDHASIVKLLAEVVRWLDTLGEPLWTEEEIRPDRIADEVGEGSFFVAEDGARVVGVFRFELADPEFWPDVPPGESAFIHRLAVRRSHAGGTVSSAILRWALARTATLRRKYLRLDCLSTRPKLKAIYEDFGFRWHSDRQVGPWHVSRYEIRIEPLAEDSRS